MEAPVVVEPADVKDTFASGIETIEFFDGVARVSLYVANTPIGYNSPKEHVIVARIVLPVDSMAKAIGKAVGAMASEMRARAATPHKIVG